MAPHKRAADSPPPQSDESDTDMPVQKKKPMKKKETEKKEPPKKNNVKEGKVNESDYEDDKDEDLLSIEIPPLPKCFDEDGKAERLHILKLKVTNFKSYYGTSTIGPFHKSFTSIIGPNGSGKSNVIDSLLFVFGYKSSKIRSKKLSSLIHSSQGRVCDSCTVEVFFHQILDLDKDKYTTIPGSEFSVARTAFKDNKSHYTLNGKIMPYKEIEKVLKERGIDLVHSRFLILQGEVEQIAMMKEKGVNGEEGMLEYLEDIIGTTRYNLPIIKLKARHKSLSVEVSQQAIRRNLARDDKMTLEPDVREAINFMKKENEHGQTKAKLLQAKILRGKDKLVKVKAEIEKNSAEINALKEKTATMKAEIASMESEEKSLSKMKDAAQDNSEKLKKTIEEVESSEARRKNNIKRCEADVAKLEADVEKEEKKKVQLDSVPAKAKKKIETLKVEAEELKEQEDEANRLADENLADFQVKSSKFEADKLKIEEKFAEKNTALNEIKAKVSVEEEDLRDLRRTADKDKNRLAELEKNLTDATDKLAQESTELENLKMKKKDLENRLAKAKAEEGPTISEEKRLGQEERELRSKLDQEKSSYNQALSGNKVQDALMKAKKEGTLPGLVGRLGDLAAIDLKYDAAISTNIGSLNNYVVETKEDGQYAIEFLKSRNLPRTTFICMDQCQVSEDRMNQSPDRFPAQRLFDLLTIPDARLKKIFYQNMGDMLVVDNISLAHQLFKQTGGRHAFCTLNGEKIDASGSLTGGGRARTGLIGSKVKMPSEDTGKKIEELENCHAEVSKKHSEWTIKMRKISEEVFECDSGLKKLNERYKYLEMSVTSTQQKVKILEQSIAAQKDKVSNEKSFDHTELENRQEALEKLIKERDEAAEEVGKVKEKLDSITAKIDAIFEELVQVHKKKAEETKEKRVAAEKTIAKETVAINNSARNIAKVDDRIAQLTKDLEKKKSELERLCEAEEESNQTEEMKRDVEALLEKVKQCDESSKELRKKLNEQKEAHLEQEKLLKEEEKNVQTLTYKADETIRKIENIEKEINGITLNHIPSLGFMTNTARPEDMMIEIDESEVERLGNLPYEELQRLTKGYLQRMVDKAIALECGMRKQQENDVEELDDKSSLIHVQLLPEEEIRALTQEELENLDFHMKNLEQQLNNTRKKINISAIEEYVHKVKKYNGETEKYKKIAENLSAHRHKLVYFQRSRHMEFMDGFAVIAVTVKELYQSLTIGGDAVLEPGGSNGSEVFTAGVSFISFRVRPLGKNWRNICNLSGGEKTLASLALVFALHKYRPTPFYVMDEIDAALDFRNVSIIGHHIKNTLMQNSKMERAHKNAQFIVISLRNNMFELADRVIGIFKVNDCTKNVQIDPESICKTQKAMCEQIGIVARTTPEEVSEDYRAQRNAETEAIIGQEPEYNGFPSSKQIERAEKVVALEHMLTKRINEMAAGVQRIEDESNAGTSSARPPSMRPVSTDPARSHSTADHELDIRLVARTSASAEANETAGVLKSENGRTKSRVGNTTRNAAAHDDLISEKSVSKKRTSTGSVKERNEAMEKDVEVPTKVRKT